jgi:arginyl-tRNA synthetase
MASTDTYAGGAAAQLARRVTRAAHAVTGLELAPADALLRPGNPERGADFQANLALSLGKRVGRDPRELAAELVAQIDVADLAGPPDVSGPGFVNFRLRDDWIAGAVAATAADPRLRAGTEHAPQRVVLDYSAPNIAKEMHVGHLRSTVIGDALARILRFVGDEVIAQNHVGDWGTQFGMLIEELSEGAAGAGSGSIADLDAFYRQARAHFDGDPAFADRARARVVALQSGDPETLAAWRGLVGESERHFDAVYALLGVHLTPADMAGESMYNDLLAPTVQALQEAGILELDDGALCAFPAGFTNRDGNRMPLIVRKSDGGYTYDTTDLAAIRHRVRTLHAQRLLYVVGAPQRQHFEMVFATARDAGWLTDDVQAEHVAFGSVLGEDNKILRTRAGENVKLVDLLDQAIAGAARVLSERGAPTDPALARSVGIGAVKYADLSGDRVKDYAFRFDRMLALDGNTSVYLQYAHARIAALLAKAGDGPADAPLAVDAPAERALALQLLRFGPVVDEVVATLQPHRLATFLYETARAFSTFYEQCPIVKAPEPTVRASRLWLAAQTGTVLATGLGLLGIDAPTRL